MSTQAPLLDQGRAVVLVSYSQFHVVVGGEPMIDALPSIDTWRNSNGLFVLGSGGFMVVTTGIHTGEVTVAVEAHSIEPPLDLSWEEVAEVSLEVIEIPPTHNPSRRAETSCVWPRWRTAWSKTFLH